MARRRRVCILPHGVCCMRVAPLTGAAVRAGAARLRRERHPRQAGLCRDLCASETENRVRVRIRMRAAARGRAAVYNSLLEICARTRDMVRGEEVVGRMARAGVLPDEDTAEARPPAAAR